MFASLYTLQIIVNPPLRTRHTRRGRYRWAERSVISAPLLRDDRSDYLGFISVHDILSALIMHMFPPGPCGYAATMEAPEWFLLDASPAGRCKLNSVNPLA